MLTTSSLSPEDSALEMRETFSHQTLILTALTAINSPAHHPSFNSSQVNKERLQYMKEKSAHTPVIDAATTILVTDTEILATMARGAHATHSIIALKEVKDEDQGYNRDLDDLLPQADLNTIDALLPDNFDMAEIGLANDEGRLGVSDKDVFISFPNINTEIPIEGSDSTCKPITMGPGHWNDIMESKSGFIIESTNVSFGNHVATVQDYLNWYRQVKNDAERKDGSTWFGEYIISSCWHKMERRIGHWAAVGLMYNLSQLTDSLSSLTVNDEAPATKRPDFKLSMYLKTMGNGESLATILQFFEYVIPSDAILPNLPKGGSTESKIVLPCLQRLCHERSYNLYNKETAIEFHHLLVATMLCYARSLRRLRNAYENRREEESKNSQAEKEMAKRDAKIRKEEMKGLKAAFKRQRAQEADGFESAISALDEFVTLAGVEEERKEEEKQMGKSMFSENRTFKFPSKSVMNTTPSPSDKATFDIIDHAARENQTFKLPSESVTTPLPTDMTKFDIAIDRAARGVFITSRILNAILVSGAFQRHIKLLVEQRFLAIPSDQNQGVFYLFSQTKDIPWQQSRRTETGPGVLRPHRETRSGVCGNSESGLGDTTNISEADLERDQDPFVIEQNDEIIMAIQGWAKLFVQHLHAKNILETFARHGGEEIPIEIKVYGVSPPENPLSLPAWEDLNKVIASSLQDKTTEEQDKMINVFKNHFQAHEARKMTDSHSNGNDRLIGKNNIFRVVSDIIAQKAENRPRYYNMHCEAALASLVDASRSPAKVPLYVNKEISAELNKLDLKEVAVSKLCCPACWDYFDILSKKQSLRSPGETKYRIRGRHSTLYPVQLPSWTSPDIAQELVRRFDKYLRDEFEIMWSQHLEKEAKPQWPLEVTVAKSGHAHNPSLQSVSSAITNASQDSAESNVDDLVYVPKVYA